MKKIKIKEIALSAIFTGVIAASSWISVYTPFGINLTLQIFAVCLTGFYLGVKKGISTVLAYIALGATGLPVFSSFAGGFGVLFGMSGGFLWGFLITVLLCGIAKSTSNKAIKYILMIMSVLLCHTLGVIQFCVVSSNNVVLGFITVSLPFLVKDLILVFLADFVAAKIKT